MNTFSLVYFVKAKLDGHRHERLKRKLPAETQWLNAIEEDIGVKKKLIERIETSEKQASDNFSKITDTLDRLTTSIKRSLISCDKSCTHRHHRHITTCHLTCHLKSLWTDICTHATSSALSPTQLIS